MPGAQADRVKETSTTASASDFTLAGAVTGFQTFNSAFGTNQSFCYCIEAVDGSGVPTADWEVGIGYLSSSTNLKRDIFLASSTGTTVTFTSGSKNVFCPFTGVEAQGAVNSLYNLTYGLP